MLIVFKKRADKSQKQCSRAWPRRRVGRLTFYLRRTGKTVQPKRENLSGAAIEERILRMEALPVLPGEIKELLALSLEDTVSAKEIASVILKSPALATKLLKVVNSPYYGFPGRISTVSQAVVILGLPATRNIALSLSVLDVFRGRKKLRVHMGRFLEHSLAAALASEELARRAGYSLAEEGFMAGLLHDVGSLVLMECVPDLYEGILAQNLSDGGGLAPLEKQVLGLTHARAGELLCRAWNLPDSLKTAVARHHDRPEILPPDKRMSGLEGLTYVGNLIAHVLCDVSPQSSLRVLQQEVRRLLAWSHDELEEVLALLALRLRETAPTLEIRVKRPSHLLECILAANRKLGEVTLAYSELVHGQKESIERLEFLEEQMKQVNKKLQELAVTDDLTGISNHRRFQERLSEAVEKASETGSLFTVVLMDLDRFREVNARHGPLYGDQVLKEVAQVLKKNCREEDIVARYGGEEFALLLPDTDAMGATAQIERQRRQITELSRRLLGPDSPLTFSAGVVQWNSQSPVTARELIQQADAALLAGKKKGKKHLFSLDSSVREAASGNRRSLLQLPRSRTDG